MTQITLSEQTKAAMLAYADNPKTPIQSRLLAGGSWHDMVDCDSFQPFNREYRIAPDPHPHAAAIRAFVANPNDSIAIMYDDRSTWGLVDKEISVTFFPCAKYRRTSPAGNVVSEFTAVKRGVSR